MPIFIKPSATSSSGGTSGPAPVNYKNFSQILEVSVPLEPYPEVWWAKGGIISEITIGNDIYKLHTFYQGESEFEVLKDEGLEVEYLLIAGGGCGGTSAYGGGGGGAGGVLHHLGKFFTKGKIPVYVGKGGLTSCQNGENSIFGDAVADGGGGGGQPGGSVGQPGGSGGGGIHTVVTGQFGAATQTSMDGATGYGNNGGPNQYSSPYPCGSGGGSETAGGRGTAGGNGKTFDITGVARRYAAGGGTTNNSGTATAGGLGGGGAGRGTAGNAPDAEQNTGSGSGGCKSATPGKAANGILFVRYKRYTVGEDREIPLDWQ